MRRLGGKRAKAKQPVQLHLPVVAVTGSAGKTTTKEMIASILSTQFTIYKSRGNRNYLGNLKAHAQQIGPEHQVAVLEYGLLYKGALTRHCRIIQPGYAVITNIGSAHVGNVGSDIRALAMAKSELIRAMDPKGKVFLNVDCSYSREFTQQPFRGRFQGEFFTIGIKHQADYQASGLKREGDGIRFHCSIDGERFPFFVPVRGEHNVSNALLAIAVSHQLGVPVSGIEKGLRQFQPQNRRLTTMNVGPNVNVIDDTYSSNPQAVKAALDVLEELETGTRIAILGSMLEMGRYTVPGHSFVGKYACRKQVDYLYALGKHARYIAAGAIRAGFPPERVILCRSKKQLHRMLHEHIRPDTSFLVKGSHRLRMNRTVDFLCRKASAISEQNG
ncbi:UDP-N-acetylmuramoyl-tripeptide--D-alanyl-D-alanine ligase [Brevibacillus borstelensis]|uniref:UDP-N-acetylmuramoyl-tripeptide--D-alanyl-D- alanine ligase n=1 Tax=Brevibacillus borstelensis TaxID=45462 RepID=UPI001D0B5AC1|nr:UDP-N-acetylmuramoyl-tripeptide--D-alanyl-D-alanine ligase [Brevibacillus borstelensis]MCC0566672.1 UDP-N-acetylmuramoyl-tripeptide--D-alanyl-D-alanine ligase [Brevibacillus borstelensis]MCM3561291.1 UDP-N-acetylmuramoyl-tripeptide--D-alanyl-D-alanine ligase [Brevibacillus borstelensis]MCM3592474.1 UDP-N-acetylmuramoyl-tripeptide--D-alanyl-D-alanine ligase [Brevibacillus borstelensis]